MYICDMKNTENLIEMITNSRFANYMTLKEWRLFAANYKSAPVLPYEMDLSSYFDMNKNKSFYEFIRYAFFFEATPEGLDYWFNISNRDFTPFLITIDTHISI